MFKKAGFKYFSFAIMATAVFSLSDISFDEFIINHAKPVCAKEKKFSEIKNKICVDEYYKKATPANNPELPESLRWMPFTSKDVDESNTEIVPVEGNSIPLGWNKAGDFSDYLLKNKYSQQIKAILEEYGITIEKLTNLLKVIGVEKGASLFDSGYLIVFDENTKKAYIIKTKLKIAEAVEKIDFELLPHN